MKLNGKPPLDRSSKKAAHIETCEYFTRIPYPAQRELSQKIHAVIIIDPGHGSTNVQQLRDANIKVSLQKGSLSYLLNRRESLVR